MKRIAWPTKITELPDQAARCRMPPHRHDRARRARRGAFVDRARQKARTLARRGQARGAIPDRRRGRPRRGAARGSRPVAVVRASDLAASAGPGDAGRATVPRDVDPCEPSLSSRGLGPCGALPFAAASDPLLAASAPAQPPVAARGGAQAGAGGAGRRRSTNGAVRQAAATRASEADRLNAQQAAAAQAIEAAEARITAADMRYQLAAAMSQRIGSSPPRNSSRIIPSCRARGHGPAPAAARPGGWRRHGRAGQGQRSSGFHTAGNPQPTRALSGQISEGQRLEATAAARADLMKSREQLLARRQQLRAGTACARPVASPPADRPWHGRCRDRCGREVERLRGEQSSSRPIRALAALLAAAEPRPCARWRPPGNAESALRLPLAGIGAGSRRLGRRE